MAAVTELIKIEANGAISFGNHTLDSKTKVEDFPVNGNVYKVKTFKELTKLERCDFEDLRRLTAFLRDPEKGCPWDAQQTHESFKRNVVEEAYELEDAIDSGNDAGIIEELGDLLFVAAMHIQIGEEHGDFDATDVLTGIVKKMIFRHKHVFGNEKAENIDQLLKIWNDAKKEEKSLLTVADEMRAVAKGFPALLRARKVLKRAYADEARAKKTLDSMNDGSAAYRMLTVVNELRMADRDAESCRGGGARRACQSLGPV